MVDWSLLVNWDHLGKVIFIISHQHPLPVKIALPPGYGQIVVTLLHLPNPFRDHGLAFFIQQAVKVAVFEKGWPLRNYFFLEVFSLIIQQVDFMLLPIFCRIFRCFQRPGALIGRIQGLVKKAVV